MDHRKYVPVLKWKMGEYQALSRLDEDTKSRVIPLIEIPLPGYDFEAKQVKKTHADHLKDFGKRLSSKWDRRRCFIDLKYLDTSSRVGNQHCLTHIFNQTVEHGCDAVPVLTVQSDAAFLKAASQIPTIDEQGLALRLSGDDFDDPKLPEKIAKISDTVGVSWGEIDVIIDLCTPDYIPKSGFRSALGARLRLVPRLNKSRSIVVVGTSYPELLAAYKEEEQFIPRREWVGYKDFVQSLDESARIPTFGDYAVAHPAAVELDMRFVKPFAKLRYTLEDKWYLAIGKAVRTAGFDQYRDMCAELVEKEFFDGRDFSAGDEYIEDCAQGSVPTGNLSTWVWVATNRHITKTVSDLSSFHGLSSKS
jgi:hypothetical protein